MIGIVLIVFSPFTLIYDSSGLNRWLFAGFGVGLVWVGIGLEAVSLWHSWRERGT